MNFADFWQNKCIFTQIAKKGASFADFWRYNHICTQPIAKKKKEFHKSAIFLKVFWQPVIRGKKLELLIFSTYLHNQLPGSFYNFIVCTLF